jgi:hypothetical protein
VIRTHDLSVRADKAHVPDSAATVTGQLNSLLQKIFTATSISSGEILDVHFIAIKCVFKQKRKF